MHKYRLFLTLATEEAWLNLVQEQGYRLTRVNRWLHRYTFEALPRETAFPPLTRLDFRPVHCWGEDYLNYVTLLADSGWQRVAVSRWGGIQYFQQDRPLTTPKLFFGSSITGSRATPRLGVQCFLGEPVAD